MSHQAKTKTHSTNSNSNMIAIRTNIHKSERAHVNYTTTQKRCDDVQYITSTATGGLYKQLLGL